MIKTLMDAMYQQHYSDMPREEFDAAVNASQESPVEGEPEGDESTNMEPSSTLEAGEVETQGPDLPDFPLEYASNDIQTDPNRVNFEIGLMKNKKTSKSAVLLPPDITGPEARKIAKGAKVLALSQDGAMYLYDPKQISESALRRQIKEGKNGHALGYGTDSVPEGGVPYAVDLDGHGTVSPEEILQLRDASKLGFSGVAPDMESAMAKIREMGRDDAEIRGMA
jgi:hypothetical protein